MKKGGNGMRPVRFPDLSKRPFHLKVIRIMEAAPSVLFNPSSTVNRLFWAYRKSRIP